MGRGNTSGADRFSFFLLLLPLPCRCPRFPPSIHLDLHPFISLLIGDHVCTEHCLVVDTFLENERERDYFLVLQGLGQALPLPADFLSTLAGVSFLAPLNGQAPSANSAQNLPLACGGRHLHVSLLYHNLRTSNAGLLPSRESPRASA